MATLEKIRSKSVLLFVIIIVALLAFILGDFLTSGRTYFGAGTVVDQAGDAKVDYNDYQNQMNLMSEQRQSQQTDNGVLSQQVIRDLLVGKMLENEYKNLGIVVTDSEISAALTGANPHPAAAQFIQYVAAQLGLQNATGAEVFQAINNPQRYNLPVEAANQLKDAWVNLEDQVEQYILRDKFDRLVLGLFTANQLDARSRYNDVATTRHIAYAVKPLSTIADDDVTLTDDDLKAAWEENKGMYRIREEVRSIDYIMVQIQPSQADRAAGQEAVETALLGLRNQEGTEAVSNDSRFVVNRASAPRARISDNNLKAFLDSATVGQAVRLTTVGDTYTLAKLIGVTTDVDSVNISALARADRGSVDSLLTAVNGGASFASLIDNENVGGQDSTWVSLVGANVPEKIKAALTQNAVGQAFVITDSVQGQEVQTLYRVNSRRSPVNVYDVATVTYTVDPSQETLTQLSGDLRTFVSNNSSADEFAKNAAEAGYTVLDGFVSVSSPMVARGAGDSRSVVKWVMEAKAGQVMPVYQDNKQTYLLTVAVKNIYDGDYLPWNADLIADQVRANALNNKKAQMLIDKYAGKAKDVAGYAKLMEVEAQNGDAMFNAPMLATIGFNESDLQGLVAAAKPNTVVGPVKGNNEVVVFMVTGEDNQGREYSFDEYAAQFNNSLNLRNAQLLQNNDYLKFLLLGNTKEKNNSLKFIQGFAE